MTTLSGMTASGTPNELHRVVQGLSDALTDQMVERLANTASNALEVVDKLNEEATRDAVMTLLDELTRLHRAGGLVALFEAVHMINAIRNAMTDSMVERLATFAETMVTNMANEEMADLAGCAHEAILEARKEVDGQPAAGGLMASLRLLGDPQTQSALRFMTAVSRRMQQHCD